MTAVIVEDDINYSLEIEMILDKLGVEVVHTTKSWESSLPIIKKLNPDVVIVDIFLSNKESGLDLARKLKQLYIPFIICTGYPHNEYSDKALELGAYGFFTKPLDKMAIAYKIKQLKKEIAQTAEESFLTIRDTNFLIRIPLQEIKWLDVKGNYTSIVTESGKRYVQKYSLKYFLDKLDSRFHQVHRSYVVNIKYVKSLDLASNMIQFEGEQLIPIGSKFKSRLVKVFK